MTPKQYYRNYTADDSWSPLSQTLMDGIMSLSPIAVLELGCGTGKHLGHLDKLGICTIGIDISPMNVYKAIHKYDLPCVILSDETYLRHLCNVDIVFTVSVLDHIDDAEPIVRELQRIANKTVYLAETNDVPGEHYYPHPYESWGFEKLPFEWTGDDGAVYYIYKWVKK